MKKKRARSRPGTARGAVVKTIPKGIDRSSTPDGRGFVRAVWRWYFTRSTGFRFGIGFLLVQCVLYGISLTPFIQTAISANLELDARWCGEIIRALGIATTVSHTSVISSRFSMSVARGCDAIEPIGFYCAAVLAFPVSIARRAAGILGGVAILFGINLIRLSTLFLIGYNWPALFEPFHIQIWPALIIIASLLLIAAWISWPTGRQPADRHAHS